MQEIFDLIMRIFTLRIPIPLSFSNNYYGYVNLFGIFAVIMFILIISYIIHKLFKWGLYYGFNIYNKNI